MIAGASATTRKAEAMRGSDMRDARGKLGEMWGLGGPLNMADMGRVLGLAGRDPGAGIRDYERETTRISGPIALAISLMLAGAKPADLAERLGQD